MAAGALAIAVTVAGGAQAQSYLSDWGIADMRQAVIAAGATVAREDNSKDPYIAATTASGLKFTITGRVCDGVDGAKRCKGALLQTSFTMDSDAEVDEAIKEYGPKFAATAVSNDGSKGLLVSRYLIFDYGVHRDNLRLNLQVFTGIAEDIWGEI
ncbi:MAG: hypothetical protein Q7J28_03300 [Caulobacter sp.]|nr:hypothetical protein [Caulobacter sp.]